MEKGPNDVSRDVWAVGEFFFYIRVLFMLNDTYRFY
jgi:hypothetical protein